MKKQIGIGLALIAAVLGLWTFWGRNAQTAINQMPEEFIETLSSQQCREQRNLARWYNLSIQEEVPDKGLLGAYLDVLDFGDGKMGYLQLSNWAEYYPIVHETGSEYRSGSVIHQFGTALPIGGKGNCPVLCLEAEVALEVDDRFSVYIMGDLLTYRVSEIGDKIPSDPRDEDLCVLRLMGESGIRYVTGTRWEENDRSG